jgi:hypothetical protein
MILSARNLLQPGLARAISVLSPLSWRRRKAEGGKQAVYDSSFTGKGRE